MSRDVYIDMSLIMIESTVLEKSAKNVLAPFLSNTVRV